MAATHRRRAASSAVLAVTVLAAALCPCGFPAHSAGGVHDCCAPASAARIGAAPESCCAVPQVAVDQRNEALAGLLAPGVLPAPAPLPWSRPPAPTRAIGVVSAPAFVLRV